MNATLWSVFITGCCVAGGVLAWNFFPKRQRLKRFAARPDLGLDEIYDEFFARQNLPKALTCELWKEVSTSLQLPPGKLRPTDRFAKELAAPKGWEFDDAIVEIQSAAERRLKQSGTLADLTQIKTVSDYVEFFCKLEAQAHRSRI